jgi:signal peptidase II
MLARFWKLLLMMVFLIIGDQLTKGAIQTSFYYGESLPILEGLFNLTYVRNTGAAFGFMAGSHEIVRQILFLFVPVIFSFWVFYMLVKSLKGPMYLSLAYALILAGATGNLIDRFTLGYVVDFLDFYIGQSHFPAFNVADSCITVAGFLLLADFFIQVKAKRSNA